MLREMTITVDDSVYARLQPMVEQNTISGFLSEVLQMHKEQQPDIRHLRGALHGVETADIRDEEDRPL